ncbi:hypothetical protein NIES2135_62530 (plasmid) [Leptolyngbya boryana NIES-2135]|jgi:hypothetical protein|uniref:Uncharacterized protein n=1 Tax=Leptolyngbya boryana NIES-2135 TaxID=1973484 RepID=A0A1Z4JRP7_LEPBY|nr:MULTISPECIES: hypothetical protein [Leptolyngbya]BAY59376.1 hypothetical protein NIES2135_62530 [Leptolyngbya boryana NIES-2135]MBD2372964.1 hypothetical protein [Leptolyngbya sp. FACHB-238]MBD2397283.1 hypothetical protein [Leptolyngbya sp. FACHB-239]MBD2403911.1 hypothetical protein [Leptolyngbya sp. FACHB-402]ULP33208.1 hypothetical protein MCP04_31040 [Leptolyngbya boryana IU 594]
MPKLKLSAFISATCLMSLMFYGVTGFSQTPRSTIRLTTDPSISQLAPFEAEAETHKPPARLTLEAIDANGQPLTNAKIRIQILTPSKTPWFTTDFPIVEGTKLLDIDAIAPQGKVQLQQTFPIRGTYQLLVNVTPQTANAFTPFQQTLTLSIPENWIKYRNFAILAAVLLIVGLVGGWIIGGRQLIQPGEIAPQRVRLLLSGAVIVAIAALLYVNVSAEMAQSGMSMPMSHMAETAPKSDASAVRQVQGLEMRLTGDKSAIVGQPARLQVNVIDSQTKQPVSDVQLKVTTTQLENNWNAFAYEGLNDTTGQFSWQQQFFDGAPHRIEVEVFPSSNAIRKFQPFQVEQTIEVEGVTPPLQVRLTGLVYFTGLIVVGLLAGFGIRRRQQLPY